MRMEAPGFARQQLGLIAMRRVSAFGDHEQAGFRQSTRDGANLLERAVLVVLALRGEHRAGDGVDVALDVPAAERRVEPDVVPAAKRRIGVVVIAGEPGTQVGALVGHAGLLDARERELFDEEMRRHDHQPGDLVTGRVEQGDGGAVAVPEQPRSLDADGGEQRGQHLVGLTLHEVGLPALAVRPGRGAAVARAREDEAGKAVAGAEALGEVFPHRHRAEPFVQEDDRWRGRACRPDPAVLDALRRTAPIDRRELRRRVACGLAHPPDRSRSRSLNRWIFPVAVFGSSSTNSNERGYL
jgi:hypothetical protein